MAITAKVETLHGEERDLYIRLNNVEASNHGMPAHALFRGYLSEEAFNARKAYVWEYEFDFESDVSKPLWQQAYAVLKALPIQELPEEPEELRPEPTMPAAPAKDAGPEAIARYTADVRNFDTTLGQWQSDKRSHEAAVAMWNEQSAEAEARNRMALALSEATDA